MKKPDVKHLFLIAIAVVAVFVSCMPNSVAVYSLGEVAVEPVYCSYFTLIEGVTGAVSLPAAGFCSCICLMLAGIFVVIKKKGLLSWIKWISLIGSILAVVMLFVKNDTVQIVPNVLVSMALLAQYFMTMYLEKKQDEVNNTKPQKRLK